MESGENPIQLRLESHQLQRTPQMLAGKHCYNLPYLQINIKTFLENNNGWVLILEPHPNKKPHVFRELKMKEFSAIWRNSNSIKGQPTTQNLVHCSTEILY